MFYRLYFWLISDYTRAISGEAEHAAVTSNGSQDTPEGLLVAKEPAKEGPRKGRYWLTKGEMKLESPPRKNDWLEPVMPDPAKSSSVYASHAGTNSFLNFFILRTFLPDSS